MRFLSCRDEASIRIEEQDPTEMRALLKCGPTGPEGFGTSDQKPVKLRVFSLAELETATGRFGKANVLGKGSHGCLYKGTLKDGKLAAVKRQENLQDEAAFNNELEILSTLHGPRFVNLVGFSRGLDAQEKLLVVDFMAHGTLQDTLHGNTSTSSNVAAAEPLGWALRVQIALQTAKALLALHSASPPVIHRDVKSSSVFLDSKWNAKLGDFGLALRGRSEDVRRGAGGAAGAASAVAAAGAASPPAGVPAGAVGYRDPEDETPTSRISTKVDIFSFGILLLEILSGRNAIDVRFKPPSILDWALPLIKEGKTHALYDRRLILLPQHSKALRHMAGIAARCVRRSSLRRPSMSYVVAGLQEVSKKMPSAKWVGGLANVMKMTTSSCQNPQVLRDVRPTPELTLAANSVMSGPRSYSTVRNPRVAVDRPLPAGRAAATAAPPPVPSLRERLALEHPHDCSKETMRGLVGQAISMDRMVGLRLRDQGTRSARELGAVDNQGRVDVHHSSRHHGGHKEDEDGDEDDDGEEGEAGGELPRATTEKYLGGRKIVYNQWRNPMFDVELRSPDRPSLLLSSDVCSRPASTHRPGSNPLDGVIPMVRFCEDERMPKVVLNRSTLRTGTVSRAAVRKGGPPFCMPSLPLSNKVRSRNVKSSSRKSHIKTRDNFEKEEAILPW